MNEFKKVIEDEIALFKDLAALEKVKLNAGSTNQISAIEECITKENTFILRLKGLEKAREEKQEALGFSGLSFKQILNKVSHEEQEALLPLFDAMGRAIRSFQDVSEDSTKVIEINLRQINKQLESGQGQIYQSTGAGAQVSHFTSRSV